MSANDWLQQIDGRSCDAAYQSTTMKLRTLAAIAAVMLLSLFCLAQQNGPAAQQAPNQQQTEKDEIQQLIERAYASATSDVMGMDNYTIFLNHMCDNLTRLDKTKVAEAAQLSFNAFKSQEIGYNRSNGEKNAAVCLGKVDLDAGLSMLAQTEPPQPMKDYKPEGSTTITYYDTFGVGLYLMCPRYVEEAGPKKWIAALQRCYTMAANRARIGSFSYHAMSTVYEKATAYKDFDTNPDAISLLAQIRADMLRHLGDSDFDKWLDNKEGFFGTLKALQGKTPTDWYEGALRAWLAKLDPQKQMSAGDMLPIQEIGGMKVKGEDAGYIAKSCPFMKPYKDLVEKYQSLCSPQNGEDSAKSIGMYYDNPNQQAQSQYNRDLSLSSRIKYSSPTYGDALGFFRKISPENRALGLQYMLPTLAASEDDTPDIVEEK